jgi:hypothetical protein
MTEPTYLTVRTIDNGRPLDYIVSGGLGGNSWGVYKQRPGERSIHRLTSPLTPIRETPAEAEIDLAIYAATRLLLPGPTRELVERYRGDLAAERERAEQAERECADLRSFKTVAKGEIVKMRDDRRLAIAERDAAIQNANELGAIAMGEVRKAESLREQRDNADHQRDDAIRERDEARDDAKNAWERERQVTGWAQQANDDRDALRLALEDAIRRAMEAERALAALMPIVRETSLGLLGYTEQKKHICLFCERIVTPGAKDDDEHSEECLVVRARAALRAAVVPNDNAAGHDCTLRPESTTPCVGCEDVAGCER